MSLKQKYLVRIWRENLEKKVGDNERILKSCGLAKKFVRVFSVTSYGKTQTNFLANPILFVVAAECDRRGLMV